MSSICDLRNELNKIGYGGKYEISYAGKIIINCTQTLESLHISSCSIVHIIFYS